MVQEASTQWHCIRSWRGVRREPSAPEPYFVDFLREAPEPTVEEGADADLEAPKVYELTPTMDFLKETLHEYMGLYNETVRGAKMDLVFFKDCMIFTCS